MKADAKREVEKKAKVPSLQEVAEDYLNRSWNRPSTVNDYRNMLFNQVLPVLGRHSPVNRFEWYSGGRQKVLDLKKCIEARGSLYQSDKPDGDAVDVRARHRQRMDATTQPCTGVKRCQV